MVVDGSGSNAGNGERQMKLRSSHATPLLLCGLVPNGPRTSTGLQPGGWGPLYTSMLETFRGIQKYFANKFINLIHFLFSK